MYEFQVNNKVIQLYMYFFQIVFYYRLLGMPGCSDCKESTYSARDPGLIPGSGRFPREGNGYPFQYSCLENFITEEPGRLQSMGSQRVGHDWVCTHTYRESPPVQYAHLVPCPEPRVLWGFPCGSAGKKSACNAGDLGFIPGFGRSPGEGKNILAWRIPWTI